MTDCEDGFSPQGQLTSLYDWLHPDGVLYSKLYTRYGFRVIYDAISSVDAKVFSVLREGIDFGSL